MIRIVFLVFMLLQGIIALLDDGTSTNPVAASVSCVLDSIGVSLSEKPDTNQIAFHAWNKTPRKPVKYFLLHKNNETQIKEIFNSTAENYLALYFHDTGGNGLEDWLLKGIDAYLMVYKVHTRIAITVDFAKLAENKTQAIENSVAIADHTASLVIKMKQMLGDLISLDLFLGLGIGANIAAKTIEILKEYNVNYKVNYFSALDPEILQNQNLIQPYVCKNKTLPRIKDANAHMIMVLHTSTCSYLPTIPTCDSKSNVTMGTVDYFANGGRNQPGCAENDSLCSRKRAQDLFKESVFSEMGERLRIFLYYCENYEHFQNGTCQFCDGCYPLVFFDYWFGAGKFFFNTGPSPPYAK